jgi:flavin-dependent dehydrogenase
MSPPAYDVIVIGAGLAGCSSAIQLAGQGYQVLLLEQQTYPVHRLCGEFLSVEVMAAFQRLGLWEELQRAGAQPIRRALLTTASGASFESSLPGMALGLSRYQLDWLLFQRAQAAGADCRDGTAVQAVSGNLTTGFWVKTRQGQFTSRCLVSAHGKRSQLDRQRPFTQRRSPFVAFKAHYRGLHLPGVIELHAFPGGYCGLSQIETGEINVCWIAQERILQSSPHLTKGVIPEALLKNPWLTARLQSMEVVRGTSHRLSQISFALKDTFDADLCRVGDAAGMITPLCGDGMAMALHSADLAVPLLAQFLQQTLDAARLKQAYNTAWNREFRTRLQIGRLLHAGFTHPTLANLGVNFCRAFPALGQIFIQATRGKPSPVTTDFSCPQASDPYLWEPSILEAAP